MSTETKICEETKLYMHRHRSLQGKYKVKFLNIGKETRLETIILNDFHQNMFMIECTVTRERDYS